MTVNILQLLIKKLEQYPQLSYKVSESMISVERPQDNGFSIDLSIDESGFNVSFDGWHESFTTEQEALECFTYGLTNRCRLKVHKRGTCEYKWTVQYKTEIDSEIEWHDDSTTGLFLYPFWKKEEIIYRQNNLTLKND